MSSRLTSGYVRIFKPGHPLAARDGYVLEHRLVLHDAGVAIPDGHHVHHINGIVDDNRPENLAVLSASAHVKEHAAVSGVINQHGVYPLRGERSCETCGDPFVPWTASGRFCSRYCANQRKGGGANQ